jgi:type II secretion system protein N
MKYGLYGLYGLSMLLVSLYIRFPSDTVRNVAARQLEDLLPGLEVAVAAARPSLPAAVQFQGIEARYGNRTVLTLDRARMSPAWGRVFRLDPAWRLTAAVGSGRLRALLRSPENGSPSGATLLADLERIELGELQGLQRLIGRRITGLCSGTVSQIQGAAEREVTLRLRLTDAAVDLKQPILRRRRVLFQALGIEADLSGGVLQVRELTFQGPEFDGRLAGTIGFKSDIYASPVAFEGSVKPRGALLAQLRKTLPESILARRRKAGAFEFFLSGSVKNPRFSLR